MLPKLPGRHHLRSSSSHQLQVPAYRQTAIGRRSFPVAASVLWNNLPPDIQSSTSLTDFCHKLKTTCSTKHSQAFCCNYQHISLRTSALNTRSSTVPLLYVPFRRTSFARRFFSTAAPLTWNSLPPAVLNCDSLSIFKSRLKTHLFSTAFC